MKITIGREGFLKALQMVSGVVERRQIMPILSNVLLIVQDDVLSITATDLEIELVGYVPLSSGAEVGSITVAARKLIDICRTLPDKAEINLFTEGAQMILRSGKSKFVLATLPAEGFPSLEEKAGVVAFSLPQSQLKNLMARVGFSMAEEDVRYYLNGMSFDFSQGGANIVAADGHRLSITSFTSDQIPTEQIQIVVPHKGVVELMLLLGDVEKEAKIIIGTNHICVKTPDFTFTSKLIDTKCPNYAGAIPKGGDKTAVIDRNLLKQALIRVSILSNEKHKGVRFSFGKDSLTLSANNPELEEVEEEMIIDYTGDDLEIGLNSSYLLDVCNAMTAEQLKIVFSDSDCGVVITGVGEEGDYIYTIMPLQL